MHLTLTFHFVTTVLDYIKTNVTQQCDQNKKAAEKIEGLLNDYNDKLKELEEALKQAKDLVGRANNQNDLNSEALADLLVMTNTYPLPFHS